MIRFNNDYNLLAHEKVLEALEATKNESFAGYGTDIWCEKGVQIVRKAVGDQNAAVFFIPGATQVNFIVAKAALSPIQSIICADTGHIYCHEAASIETVGHKMLPLPNSDGKITAAQIQAEAAKYFDNGEDEFLTEPHLVYISFATEQGTIYTKQELTDISAVCRKYNMLLYVDGARMGYGLGAKDNDLTLNDFAKLTDAFFIGGTKCGAMFGEALIITNKQLQRKFRSYMKQSGAIFAKGWTMGLQFCALLENGLYFEITKRADEYAMRIKEAFKRKGCVLTPENSTNQQFVVLTGEQKAKLAKDFVFEDCGSCVRFCTSWGTKEEEINALVKAIEKL